MSKAHGEFLRYDEEVAECLFHSYAPEVLEVAVWSASADNTTAPSSIKRLTSHQRHPPSRGCY